jgi:two-component system, NtrC family, nitrogen regulation sensor histidine kinase NtrY
VRNPDVSKVNEPRSPRRQLTRRRLRIILLAVTTVVLFALLVVQVSFNTLPWLSPETASETLILYALSTINLLAFLVILMILVRNLIKLRRERIEQRLGARFKTRIVLFFVSLSLLPVLFLFFASYGLINRSVDKWFSLPASEMVKNAREIQAAYVDGEREQMKRAASTLARLLGSLDAVNRSQALAAEYANLELTTAVLFDADGNPVEALGSPVEDHSEEFKRLWQQARSEAEAERTFAAQVIEGFKPVELIAAAPLAGGGWIALARPVPSDLAERANEINRQDSEYDRLKGNQRLYKQSALLTLGLITLLVLFIATWMALWVARTIAVPVQQLAEATQHIKHGDLAYRADIVGDDELASLAVSFNEMTEELFESRRRLEERRRYIETVLESLSAGVVSLDENGLVTTINEAAKRLLHLEDARVTGVELEALLPEEQREELRRLIRRAARLHSVTREVHFTLANQVKLDAAVTVTAFHDPEGEAKGVVIVIEDLSELIEAQRRAAWSEVARTMAHEIKNPLTPIRLSAERLAKKLLDDEGLSLPKNQQELVRDCTSVISAEVATLQRMVDEFSNFARLPAAEPQPVSLNEIVESAIKLYDERLEGITIETRLAASSPVALADAEQIKRVLVNLIDNGMEALLETRAPRTIVVETRENQAREVVELVVTDNGPGIPRNDRGRIFEPYYSTRRHGTGLGLAIVSRIAAEHHGRILVSENLPHGARFILELPNAKSVEAAGVI